VTTTTNQEGRCAIEDCSRYVCIIAISTGKRSGINARREQSAYCKRHEPRLCQDVFCYRIKQDKPDAKWCPIHQSQATRAANRKGRIEEQRQKSLEAGELQAHYEIRPRYEVKLACPVDATTILAFDTGLDPVPMGGVQVQCPHCRRSFKTPRHYYPGSLTAPQPERNHGTG
jgi:hypothetical protein